MVVSLNIHNHLSSSSDTACEHLLAFNLELQLHHQSRSAYEQTQVSVLDSKNYDIGNRTPGHRACDRRMAALDGGCSTNFHRVDRPQ